MSVFSVFLFYPRFLSSFVFDFFGLDDLLSRGEREKAVVASYVDVLVMVVFGSVLFFLSGIFR